MTPEWARLPISAAPWETESVRDVVLGSCRVFKGNLGYLVGTARCGPACRVVWDPGLTYWVSPRGPDSIGLIWSEVPRDATLDSPTC
jgi:hypothetical protein